VSGIDIELISICDKSLGRDSRSMRILKKR
jgi:hypothetical protein